MSNVTFGMTKKRINSTSRQMNSGSVTLDCKLKEPCGVHNPVFIVQGLDDSHRWNYCSWRGAYYYIDEVIYKTNDIKEVHCHLDPLATFKGSIDDTYAFVQFGDAQHTLDYLDDPRFGPDHKIDKVDRQGTIDIGMDKEHWTVIMTVNAATGIAHNGVLVYAMTLETCTRVLNSFTNTVIGDAGSWTVGDFFQALQNIYIKIALGGGQAIDNIRSMIAVPFAYSSYGGTEVVATLSEVGLGPYRVTLDSSSEVKVLNPVIARTGSDVIYFNRPLITTSYKWLNLPKYCSIQLGHPCGYLEINDVAFLEETMCVLYYSVCPVNGDYCIKVTTGNKEDETIAEVNGNVSIDLSYLANGNKTVGDQMFALEAKIASYALGTSWLNKQPATVETYKTNTTTVTPTLTAAGNPSSKPVVKMQEREGEITHYNSNSGISGNYRIGSISPSVSGGSLGNGVAAAMMASVGKAVYYNIEHYYPSIFEGGAAEYMSFCNNYGYPVGRYMRIGDNKGYVECVAASVGTGHVTGIPGATPADLSTINSYLNTGIILED